MGSLHISERHVGLWNHVMRVLSFVFYRSWSGFLFFSTIIFRSFGPEIAGPSSTMLYEISVTTLALSLAICAVLHHVVLRCWEHQGGGYLGPVICLVGIDAMLVPTLLGGTAPGIPQLAVGGVLTGVGSSFMLLRLGRAFAHASPTDAAIDTLAVMIVNLLASAVGVSVPPLAATVLVLVLPFLMMICLGSLRETPALFNERGRGTGMSVSAGILVRLAACACAFGIVTEWLRSLYVSWANGGFDDTFSFYTSIIIAAAALLLVARGARRRHWQFTWFYRGVVVLIVTGLSLFSVIGEEDWPFSGYLIVNAGYALFESFVWVLMSVIANRYQYTTPQVFGFGRAIVLLAGNVAGVIASHVMALTPISLIVTVALVSVIIMYSFVLTDTDVTLFQQGLEGDVRSGGTEGDGFAHTPSSGSTAARRQVARPKVPLAQRCAIIGDAYGLTPREKEIYYLLAVGRNSARIQEECAISAGTVNTHLRHIFHKLDVHSQQELIDQFQDADLDALQRRSQAQSRP